MTKPKVVGTIEEDDALAKLSDLTRLTGSLHEVQVRSLTTWAIASSVSVVSASIDWDPVKSTILFLLTVDPAKIEPDFARRMEVLRKSASAYVNGATGQVRIRKVGTTTGDNG